MPESSWKNEKLSDCYLPIGDIEGQFERVEKRERSGGATLLPIKVGPPRLKTRFRHKEFPEIILIRDSTHFYSLNPTIPSREKIHGQEIFYDGGRERIQIAHKDDETDKYFRDNYKGAGGVEDLWYISPNILFLVKKPENTSLPRQVLDFIYTMVTEEEKRDSEYYAEGVYTNQELKRMTPHFTGHQARLVDSISSLPIATQISILSGYIGYKKK